MALGNLRGLHSLYIIREEGEKRWPGIFDALARLTALTSLSYRYTLMDMDRGHSLKLSRLTALTALRQLELRYHIIRSAGDLSALRSLSDLRSLDLEGTDCLHPAHPREVSGDRHMHIVIWVHTQGQQHVG
jgi:hypothetical protein